MFLSLTAFVVWFVIMLAMRQQTNSGQFVTASRQNNSGWSPGVAWVLAISNALFCYGGTDSAIHSAEEMRSPGRNLPIVM
jgi:choline transport protein